MIINTSEPISIDEHWNCGVCGCSHHTYLYAQGCYESDMKNKIVINDFKQGDSITVFTSGRFPHKLILTVDKDGVIYSQPRGIK